MQNRDMILEVKNLNLYFQAHKQSVQILHNISFGMKANACLGILGKSGSGKSMLYKSIMGLLDDNFSITGEAVFQGQDLLKMSKEQKRLIRGNKITVIVQNPMTAFDPLFTLGNQILSTLLSHGTKSPSQAKNDMLLMLDTMNIPNAKTVLKKYPHELSGGMLQRLMIGVAILPHPVLVIADEPTTAIDSLNQARVLQELKRLKSELGLCMLFISHDLHALAHITDEIIVLDNGAIIESADTQAILHNPQQAQTKVFVQTRQKLLKKFQHCRQGGL